MSILVITTGGTIGALPYEDIRRPARIIPMPPKGVDYVRDFLANEFVSIKNRCVSFGPIDSNLMDDTYRQSVWNIIEKAPENAVAITHGTDSILKSAEFFYGHFLANPALQKKMILLTGSMVPLAHGPESDGYQNLEFSLKHLDSIKNKEGGVYIVLCDYEHPETGIGAWKPRLYHYAPGRYEKVYTEDGRNNRLRRVT